MNINTGKSLTKTDSLNQSINLILLTPKGERVLNRNFGSNISETLGQPINNVIMEISAEVISALQSNDSRILVDNVSISAENNALNLITINYNNGETGRVFA
ncbi:MAG: GPW/gp25 family protein [Alphaproteobacteria bacterium]|jgi:phage baseplate assembly protein W|nr:GPW/gp25 family protein [Alphaproteobacteria bacterium]